MLTLAQFETLLGSHGGDLSTWPTSERARAEQLLQSDTEARRLLAQQQQLDALLADPPCVEPSAELRRAVAEVPLRHPQGRSRRSVLARLVEWLTGERDEVAAQWASKLPHVALAAAAFSIGVGVLSGLTLDPYEADLALDDSALQAEGDELSALALAEDLDGSW